MACASDYDGVEYSALCMTLTRVQIGYKNQQGVTKDPLTVEKAVSLIQDVFTAAAERDIYTGDGLTVNIITSSGTEVREVPLRRD